MVATYLEVNEREVKNNAGGLVFSISPIERLERFLILGTVGGTYYVGEREHTHDNLVAVEKVINDLGVEAVDKIVEIGTSNRAPKHDPVLVAYSIAISNPSTSNYALSFFNRIVRTGTHLFHLLAYTKKRRGYGRAYKRAIANWYLEKKDEALAYQLVKYKQRDGWSHRDVMRVSHPQSTSASQNALIAYATSGTLNADDSKAHAFVEAAIEASQSDDLNRVVLLVEEFNLPRETINTALLKEPRIHEALAPRMGLTALLRNLRNMAKDGYLVQGSEAVKTVRNRLLNETDIRRSRIHPAHVFLAKFNAENIPVAIQNALEETFFASFGNVEPTNLNLMLALDVSGSMSGGGYSFHYGREARTPTPREWSALQAMVTARVEPFAEFRAFSNTFMPLNITARDSMEDVLRKISGLPFQGTDCSLPMLFARAEKAKFDGFAVYTDNETWARGTTYKGVRSSGNAMQELRAYRQSSGINAKLAVVGITSTQFSIADPNDRGSLDFVGFDADAPAIMADFFRG